LKELSQELSVFDILKKLLPSVGLDPVASEFKKTYEAMELSIQLPVRQNKGARNSQKQKRTIFPFSIYTRARLLTQSLLSIYDLLIITNMFILTLGDKKSFYYRMLIFSIIDVRL
jgi:hypothetical protein